MNIQNMANRHDGLLCAQSEDIGILNAKNLRQFGTLLSQTEIVKEKTVREEAPKRNH